MKIINIFDFDGTLTTKPRPPFIVFARAFGFENSDDMYEAINEYRKTHSGDRLQTQYDFYNTKLQDISVKVDDLMVDEEMTAFNPGVLEFLQNSNELNYIISGGLQEYLERLSIAKYFHGIYASKITTTNGLISRIIEPMTILKKIDAIKEIMSIHSKSDCFGINYIGDGITDGPALDFVHQNRGRAILVYRNILDNKVLEKFKEKRYILDCVCQADYREGSKLLKSMKWKCRYLDKEDESFT